METWIAWGISLMGMVVLTVISYRSAQKKGEFATLGPITTGDILRSEAGIIGGFVVRTVHKYWPHARRILAAGGRHVVVSGVTLYRGFADKVFGKEGMAQGKTTSFFIKHIREFKEELSKDDRI